MLNYDSNNKLITTASKRHLASSLHNVNSSNDINVIKKTTTTSVKTTSKLGKEVTSDVKPIARKIAIVNNHSSETNFYNKSNFHLLDFT